MPETNQIPIFLINLDHRTDRLANMAARLEGIHFKRIPAIYGKNLDNSEFTEPISQHTISKNEIATICSHRKTWQKIVDRQIPYACILEDDVILSDSFPGFIKDEKWLPGNFDVIKLETFKHEVYLSPKRLKAKDRFLQQLGAVHTGAAGYILSLKGATKLLEITRPMNRPVDSFIFEVKSISSELKILQMIPALCIQECHFYPNPISDSDIEDDRALALSKQKIPFIHKLWRETKRPCFQMLELIRIAKERLIKIDYVPFL